MHDPNAPPLLTSPWRARNWLQRALIGVIGLAFAVMAFFFITAVLIVGTVAAAAIALRFWWHVRKLRAAQKAAGPLEGEYTVVHSERLPENLR